MTEMTEDDARLLELAYDSSDESDAPEAMRCKYPSKYCGHARAAKASGQLHRFCELHRRRANVNQKRWTAVRRHPQKSFSPYDGPLAGPMPMANYYGIPVPWTESYDGSLDDHTIPQRLPHAHAKRETTARLNDDDIDILTELLAPTDAHAWPLDAYTPLGAHEISQ